jgi:4-diphosphocytidyl-2-C-methyl-D-erythritol kinase
VLLALPVLAGHRLPLETLARIGEELGSDVPFFLQGGTALGLGRGTELYPLPDAPARFGLIAASGIHVSTAEAYAALKRPLLTRLTNIPAGLDTGNFSSFVWGLAEGIQADEWSAAARNDFEEDVFRRNPILKTIREQFRKLGARPAMMSGSGSALFGLWPSREQAAEAASRFRAGNVAMHQISLVSRRRYRALWLRQLREHITGSLWPPQSRYVAK